MPHDFEMAGFFGADVHQQIFAIWILAVQALYRILHRGRELAVGAAELFKKHVAETRVRLVDADGEHQLLDVVIHGRPRSERGYHPRTLAVWFVPVGEGVLAVDAIAGLEMG